VEWTVRCDGIEVAMSVALPPDDVAELWTIRVPNRSGRARRLSLYPYFPDGYMSWMNQAGSYRADLGGIVCTSVTPYQKVEDWFRQRDFLDRTVLLHDRAPAAWEANQAAFEGEGGLAAPDAIVSRARLACGDALYETPTAVLQYPLELLPGAEESFRFVFAPARDDAGVEAPRAPPGRGGCRRRGLGPAGAPVRCARLQRGRDARSLVRCLRQPVAAARGVLPRRQQPPDHRPADPQLPAGPHGHGLSRPAGGA